MSSMKHPKATGPSAVVRVKQWIHKATAQDKANAEKQAEQKRERAKSVPPSITEPTKEH